MTSSVVVKFIISNTSNDEENAEDEELPFLDVTIKDLITWKIRKDVEEFNNDLDKKEGLHLLDFQIDEMVRKGKVALPKKRKKIDPEIAIKRGLENFRKNQYSIFIDNKQFSNLSEVVSLRNIKTIKIIKLIPLVGG